MKKPTPINEEVFLEDKKYIVSHTDTKGIIKGANAYFSEISGYSFKELKNQNHNIVRHPDMPKIIFKLMWERIQNKQNIFAFVKNLCKDGRFYWVITDFEVILDKKDKNKIIGYYAYRKAPPRKALPEIEKLYKALLEEEKKGGMEASAKYLNNFLSKKKLSYDEYISDLLDKATKKSFISTVKSFF